MTTRTINLDAIELTPKMRRWLGSKFSVDTTPGELEDIVLKRHVMDAFANGLLGEELFTKLQSPDEEQTMSTTATPENVLGSSVNLRDQSSKYSTKRHAAKHAKLGEVFNPSTGRVAELASQLDNAKAGVMFKNLAARSGLVNVSLSEHEKQLLEETASVDEWVGEVNGEHKTFAGAKALLDDATSGGQEIVPVHFDANIITFPLLTGELFPRVNVVDVNRGRLVEAGSVGNPTVSWGQGDNTQVSLFDTSSLVAGIDTTIFGVAVAIEVGRDFLSDSAVDVGSILTQRIGERLSEELDDVVANGNGTTQPQGILNASGLSSVTPDNTTTGPPTLNDYTSLMFSIGKQYRTPGCAFLSNDTTYQRSRSIRVDDGGSTDQRPVMTGGDTTSFNQYSTLGWSHAIQNDVPNGSCVFGNMNRYRLYRRQGLELRFIDGGTTLARKNLVLLVARARFGGKVMDASAFAKWTNGQS